jgi:hypothetical protein
MPFPTKYQSERVFAGTDWTRTLESGETILSASVSIVPKSGRDSNASSMVSGGAAVNGSGNAVSQLLIGGKPGVIYETRWTVVTDRPRTLEERVDVTVQ